MIYTVESREFHIEPGVTCLCEIPVPDLSANPTQAQGLGENYSEKNEKLDQLLSEVLFPQYTHAVKQFVSAYLSSKLPEKYIHGHTIAIVPMPVQTPAAYHNGIDMIAIEPDILSIGYGNKPGNFVYGHEFGHRIIFFKSGLPFSHALSSIESILSISDAELSQEILCDAIASIICGNCSPRYDAQIASIKQEGLKRVALQLAWSC